MPLRDDPDHGIFSAAVPGKAEEWTTEKDLANVITLVYTVYTVCMFELQIYHILYHIYIIVYTHMYMYVYM